MLIRVTSSSPNSATRKELRNAASVTVKVLISDADVNVMLAEDQALMMIVDAAWTTLRMLFVPAGNSSSKFMVTAFAPQQHF